MGNKMKNVITLKRTVIIGILLLLIMICIGCETAEIQKAMPTELPVLVEDVAKINTRGEQYLKGKIYMRALDSFSAAIRIDPTFQIAYINRGLTYYLLGRYFEAIEDFTQTIMLGSQDLTQYVVAHIFRGECYNELKEYDQAISDLTKALELNPLDDRAYNSRSLSYYRQGKFSEALDDVSSAIDLEPSYMYYDNRGTIYATLKDYYKALSDFTMSLKLNPNNAITCMNCGAMSRELSLYEDSLHYYNQAITLNPRLFGAYNGRGTTYFYLEEYEKALQDLHQAIQLNPDGANLYIGRGHAYSKLGRYQEAMDDYNKAIVIDPGHAAAYYGRGNVYFDLGRYDDALRELNKSLELDPHDKAAYEGRGKVYRKLAELAVNENTKNEYFTKFTGTAFSRLVERKRQRNENARVPGTESRNNKCKTAFPHSRKYKQ
jgi:tetratricopeptide (TPR) repeat protein